MNNKRITKRASGLCLALMAGLFVLCTTTVGFGQATIDQPADCFTLSITTTGGCGGVCDNVNCDHCATFTLTNVSTNCDITSLTIAAIPGPGTSASTCFSTCSPQGPPNITVCDERIKVYSGSYPPNGSNGIPNTLTICHAGATARYFRISAGGTKFNPGGINDCCATSAIVHF